MATYYKWRKSTIKYTTRDTSLGSQKHQFTGVSSHTLYYVDSGDPTPNQTNGTFDLPRSTIVDNDDTSIFTRPAYFSDSEHPTSIIGSSETKGTFTASRSYQTITLYITSNYSGNLYKRESIASPNSLVGYVYSTSSSAYPNGGVQDGYYYDQRTTVESPAAPTGLTYPAQIVQTGVDLSWTAAGSNTDYPVSEYEVSYSTNGGSSWTVAGTTANTSYSFAIPAGTLSIQFRVRAKDSNNQWGNYVTGTASQVILAPDLTVPQMVMQGQQATISWSAIEGADSYTLQRKSSADADWTQVYSGANLSYTETVGTWTSLQYRVQAVFGETAGGWATSDPIQIVSASALVISGQDGDLGTLVNDVPYSISSDQASPTIDVTVEVNGGEYASFQATSGQTYKVGVLDLPTGTGSIVITASATVNSSPVTVTRTWTYSKTDISFPDNGSVAGLTQEGATIWLKTLDEAVRTALNPWGGNLSTALNLLKNAALFNRTKQPKYSEVTISMANVTEGQIINIPRGGVMVPHYVGTLEYESALNGAGRRLLVPVDCYDQRTWNSNAVNTYANSDIDTWMNGDYKTLFPEEIQTAMGATKFYYTPGNNNWTVGILERSIFALSGTELGETYLYVNEEGSTLPISPTLKVAHKNGEKIEQWTRSPFQNVTSSVEILDLTGEAQVRNCSENACGSRPCFTLPSTFTYGPVYVAQDGTIHASQEYTEAGDWLDVWGNAIPAVKMETGSYVGTGTSGTSHPNTLTFDFVPKVLIVYPELPYDTSGSACSWGFICLNGMTNVQTSHYGRSNPNSPLYVNLTWDGNSVSWNTPGSSTSDGMNQCNGSGKKYYYVAIG